MTFLWGTNGLLVSSFINIIYSDHNYMLAEVSRHASAEAIRIEALYFLEYPQNSKKRG